MDYSRVKGKCPACGWSSLFVGDGGYLTCAIAECPNPSAVHKLLTSVEGASSGNASGRIGESQERSVTSELSDPPDEIVTPSSEIHTCHAACACQHGGDPTPDFLGVRPVLDNLMEAGRQVVDARTEPCLACGGTGRGWLERRNCGTCFGTGKAPETEPTDPSHDRVEDVAQALSNKQSAQVGEPPMALSDLCEGDRRELRQQARAAIAALQPGLDGNGPLDAILYERERHEQAKRDGKFSKTCADDMTDRERLPVLMEEVGEVARAMLEGDGPNLREELAQVGAVALAWIEGLDAAALTEKENDR